MRIRDALFPVLLCLILSPGAASSQIHEPNQDGTGTIQGKVVGHRGTDRYPLPQVMLDLVQGRRYRTVVTDSMGRYSVRGLTPGSWRVRALHVGHQEMEVEVLVPPGGDVQVDMDMAARPIPLPPLVVQVPTTLSDITSAPLPTREEGEVSLRALEGTTGMVEAGLAQVVRALPGNNQAEPTDVLLMRGSAADLKLVLLDGAPVYTPFHMGGMVESFDPEALGAASLFLGGAPARFDGGLSYILDLRTRAPRRDRFRAKVGADLLTTHLLMEGPFSGGGILLGSRTVHGLGAPALGRGESPYRYRDILVRGEWGDRQVLGAFLTGFLNRESVRLNLGDLAPAEGASWGNKAITGGVSGQVGRGFGEIRGSLSRYDNRLPVADSIPLFARSQSDRVRLTADLSRPWGEGSLRMGISLDASSADYSAMGVDSLGNQLFSALRLKGTSGGVYAEGTRPLGQSLIFRGGLRVDRFSGNQGLRAAPRASLSWMLTEGAILTFAAGHYNQLAPTTSSQVGADLAANTTPENIASASSSTATQLSVAGANHLVVSLDQILAPGLRMGLEGYMKSFSGISPVGESQLNASGVDLRVAREGARASGWVGYTLTWFWASGEGFLGENGQFSGRHLLSAGLSANLSERVGARIRVGYGDGLPYTSIPISNPTTLDGVPVFDNRGDSKARFEMDGSNLLNETPSLSVGPDKGFLRVDGEIFASWAGSIGGRSAEFRPYLRLLNALNRRDALFYHFEPWRSPNPRPLAELPVLPVLGIEVIF